MIVARQMLLVVVAVLTFTLAAAQSPDNSRVPPLASVTASGNAVFTFAPGSSGPSRPVWRNGVDTQGAGSEILIWKLTAYVKGDDANWYRYTGSTTSWPWEKVGPVDPAGGPVLQPVLVDTQLTRLGWTQPGQTVAQTIAGITRLYVDDLGTGLILPAVCTVVGGATTCTAPIPALTTGTHALAISYTPNGGTAVGRSNTISITVTITPTGLSLKP